LRPPSQRYPHFVKSPTTGELVIALGRDDKSKELKDAVERAQQQELERLLYVATTRARHTLILALDQEIFATTQGHLPRGAQLRRLVQGADVYQNEFDAHSNTIEGQRDSDTLTPASSKSTDKIDKIDPGELKRAAKRASEFVRKFTPSALDEEMPVELRVQTRLDNPAMLYGRWWHKLLERIDWKGRSGDAQKLFDTQLPTLPNAEAATKDWNATREKLFSDATIAGFIGRAETQFYREFPFSWRRKNNTVLEGFIDSLMIDREAGKCLLLDWKTNAVSASEVEKLRSRYRPQLAAYWKAVSEITQLDVAAGLFSTALGRFLLYEKSDLQKEWDRLEKVPPAQLESEIQPDERDG
jgi:ATP-dependent exoDNAse (exonuclease V) beta subunit